MAESSQPKVVRAAYKFHGTNNDELQFSKGDIITITQTPDGGWWEGTLNGKTGWFPSNYVKEIVMDPKSGFGAGKDILMNKRESMAFYHSVVLQNVVETERTHVTELQTLQQTYLLPLKSTAILSAMEYSQLCGNLEEILSFQQGFLAQLEDCSKSPSNQQRVGGIFMMNAPQLMSLYKAYYANHPRAVNVLTKKREELNMFMEDEGSPSPGIMTLTTSLSNPFRRLDKYPVLLKELERHIEESHIDRGDTQRAIAVYRDIANQCTEIRKLKELEYDIMSSSIMGWEGEDISKLGELLLLSHVIMHFENGEKKERLFLLFPGLLVMLSTSLGYGGYQFERKLSLTGMKISVNPVEDTEAVTNAFEITSTMIDRIVVSCVTQQEQQSWVKLLRQQLKGPRGASVSSVTPVSTPTHAAATLPQAKIQPMQFSTSQPSINTLPQAKKFKVTQQPMFKAHKTWSLSCLRPCPPLRPSNSIFVRDDPTKSPRSARKLGSLRKKPERAKSEDDYLSTRRIDDSKTLEEDALILRVIEAYCTSAKTRHTVNSSLLDSPHMLIAEEEKIIFEVEKEDSVVVEEKTLVDTVYAIKDQLKELKQQQDNLKKDVEEEQNARKRMESRIDRIESIIRKYRKSQQIDGWDENNPNGAQKT